MTSEPVRWLPKGPPRSSRAWNYAGQAGVASSNPEGADPPPHPPTYLGAAPWAPPPAGPRAAGTGSRLGWQVRGSLWCRGGRRPTCAKAGKEEWESRRQAPLTDLATGLRGPRVQALRALRGAPEVWDSQVVARARVRARGEGGLESGWEEKHHRPHTTREQRFARLPGAEPRRGCGGPGPPARPPPAPQLASEAGGSARAGSPRPRSSCKPAPPRLPDTAAFSPIPRPES